jgi:predicted dehydrogenase
MLVPGLTEFAQSIAEGRPPAVTPADGRRVLKVLGGAIESARTGQQIQIASAELVRA